MALKVSDLCFCPIADVAGNLGVEHFQSTKPLCAVFPEVASVHNNGDLRLSKP